MTQRPPLLTLLASLAVHVAALALLFFFASGERIASALVIDLSELEPVSEPPGPKQERTGSARPAGRGAAVARAPSPPAKTAGARAPVEPAPPVVSAPAPSTPEPTPQREVVPAKPESRPEPAVEAVREEAPVATGRSAPVAAAPSEQPSQAPGAGVGRGATEGPQGTTGGSASGSGTGVAMVPSGPSGGGAGSEYGSYYRHIRQRIQETLEYPPAARRRGIKGTVLLELLIKPDGAISAVVKVSSSHRLLDDAALETVRNLPRQPFPPGLAPRQLTVPLPVVFDLK